MIPLQAQQIRGIQIVEFDRDSLFDWKKGGSEEHNRSGGLIL